VSIFLGDILRLFSCRQLETDIVYIRIELKDVGLGHGAAFFSSSSSTTSNNVSSKPKRSRQEPLKGRRRKQMKTGGHEMVSKSYKVIFITVIFFPQLYTIFPTFHNHSVRCNQPTVFFSHTKPAPATSQPVSSIFLSQQINTSHQPRPAEQNEYVYVPLT